MNKKTKFSKLVNEKIDSSKTYTIDEAVSIIMEFKRASFVESVDKPVIIPLTYPLVVAVVPKPTVVPL